MRSFKVLLASSVLPLALGACGDDASPLRSEPDAGAPVPMSDAGAPELVDAAPPPRDAWVRPPVEFDVEIPDTDGARIRGQIDAEGIAHVSAWPARYRVWVVTTQQSSIDNIIACATIYRDLSSDDEIEREVGRVRAGRSFEALPLELAYAPESEALRALLGEAAGVEVVEVAAPPRSVEISVRFEDQSMTRRAGVDVTVSRLVDAVEALERAGATELQPSAASYCDLFTGEPRGAIEATLTLEGASPATLLFGELVRSR